MVIVCCDRLLAHSANFIKLISMVVKYFWRGCFMPPHLLHPGATAPLSYATADTRVVRARKYYDPAPRRTHNAFMATVCPVHDPKSAGELGLSKPVECFSLHCSDTVGWTTLQEGHSAIGGGRFGMEGGAKPQGVWGWKSHSQAWTGHCAVAQAPPLTNTGAPWPLRIFLIIMVTISVDRQHYR